MDLTLICLLHSSPLSFKDITALGMSCMADYGGPVFPFLAVGGYNSKIDSETHGHCHMVRSMGN